MDMRLISRHGDEMPYEKNVTRFIQDKVMELGGSEPLAERLGVSDRIVNYWLRGGRSPSRNTIRQMAQAFETTVDAILSYKDEGRPDHSTPTPEEFIPIPYLEQEALGGPAGIDAVGKKVKSYLAFSAPWIYSKGNPANMFVMRVRGTSMINVLPPGCIVLFDESWKEVSSGKIYVVAHNGKFKVKRIVYDIHDEEAGVYDTHLYSDDGLTRSEMVMPDDYFEVIGKVLWYGCDVD